MNVFTKYELISGAAAEVHTVASRSRLEFESRAHKIEHLDRSKIVSNYILVYIEKFESCRSHKASFCLEDTECLPGRRQKYDCKTEQAISPGCADIYVSGIDCQVSPKIECKSIKIILHAFKVPKNLRSFSEPLATTSTGILAHV